MSDTLTKVVPSATPSDADLVAWQDLPRDEQVRLMREFFAHSDCSTPSALTMDDVRKLAAQRIAERDRG